jgi:putative ABC transport system permease protein
MTALGPVLLIAGVGLACCRRSPTSRSPPTDRSPACCSAASPACRARSASRCAACPAPRHPLALLAVERARRQRNTATIAVAGVVASLSLAVALTVMVGSFRESVLAWLDTVLPADLYVRSGSGGPSSEPATLPAELAARACHDRWRHAGRVAARHAAAARPGEADRRADRAHARRPGGAAAAGRHAGRAAAGRTAAYVSEAMVDLYDARPGTELVLPLPDGTRAPVHVRGVWRDYARQHGAAVLASADYQRLTGDLRSTDIALWLRAGTEVDAVRTALRRTPASSASTARCSSSPSRARSAPRRCASSIAASR